MKRMPKANALSIPPRFLLLVVLSSVPQESLDRVSSSPPAGSAPDAEPPAPAPACATAPKVGGSTTSSGTVRKETSLPMPLALEVLPVLG